MAMWGRTWREREFTASGSIGAGGEPRSSPKSAYGTVRSVSEQHHDLGTLIGDWLDWATAAAQLGVTVSKVRQWIREGQLAAVVPAPGAGQQVPALLIDDGVVVKGVPGVLTVLHDGGYDDAAALAWLFTDDPSLPGRPIDALRENRGTEVKRRAQAMAF